MIIALDMDGVCYAWDKTARYMLRRRLAQERRPIPVELFHPSTHWDTLQHAIEPHDWDWLWNEAIDLGLYRYGHCERGAIEGVEELGRLGKVKIVTARPRRAMRDTYDWLSFMFDRANIDDVIFTDDKHEVEASLYVDDAAHHAIKLHGMGKTVIVYGKPWNSELPLNVGVQVRTWPEIVAAVRERVV